MARRESVELLDQVADLCEQFADNRELTREVANLLFKHGEKPNAGRVHQLTRRGSMATLTDEMEKWWADLRAKLDVRLVNPTLPAPLLEKQGEVLGQIWDLALAAAKSEMEVHREEANRKVATAEEARRAAESMAAEQRQVAQAAESARAETEQKLVDERAARAAAEGETNRWRTQAEASTLQLERDRAEAASQLAAQRAAAEKAEQQFNDMRRQNLLEIDGLRTNNTELRQALKKAEHQLHDLKESERGLRETERSLHDKIAQLNEAIARLTGETSSLSVRLDSALADRESLERVRVEERESHREALATRDDLVAHLRDSVAAMKRTESRLEGDVERLNEEKACLAGELAKLRAELASLTSTEKPASGQPDKT